jgi:hypothetical protein
VGVVSQRLAETWVMDRRLGRSAVRREFAFPARSVPFFFLHAEVDMNLYPSPPWGRGWPATGAFTSRGGTGEGVKTGAAHSNLT